MTGADDPVEPADELLDAPNQQVVRPDASAPWDEGTGGTPADPDDGEPDDSPPDDDQGDAGDESEGDPKPAAKSRKSTGKSA